MTPLSIQSREVVEEIKPDASAIERYERDYKGLDCVPGATGRSLAGTHCLFYKEPSDQMKAERMLASYSPNTYASAASLPRLFLCRAIP